jgi:hypothetical protein
VICIFQILPEQKPDSLLSGKFPSLPPEQLSPEHPPPTSIITPQEEPHFDALSARATSPLLLQSLSTTLEQITLGDFLLLL